MKAGLEVVPGPCTAAGQCTPSKNHPPTLELNNFINMDSIEAALADLKLQETPNYTVTAKKYGVDRTTLSRRHRGVTIKRGYNPKSNALLSIEQRKTLIAFINQLTEQGLPPTARLVRRFAFDISGKMPGKNWVGRFVKSTENELASSF